MKCSTKRGCAVSHFWIAGVLWVELLSRMTWTSSSAGTSRSSRLQELLELDRAVSAVQRPDHLAGAEVQGGVEARSAVALVVVRRALGQARPHRQDRRRAVQRLDLGLLVHAQHDGALGRVQVEADDVSDLGHELRIAASLNVSARCGWSPNARQIRCTADCVSPTSAAIERVDQCVASLGALSRVLVITSSTCASVTVRGRPGRGSSTRPSSRSASNRRRHFATVLRCTPRRSATSPVRSPSATSNTILDRCASACAVVNRRDHDSNCSRSASLSSIDTQKTMACHHHPHSHTN